MWAIFPLLPVANVEFLGVVMALRSGRRGLSLGEIRGEVFTGEIVPTFYVSNNLFQFLRKRVYVCGHVDVCVYISVYLEREKTCTRTITIRESR